MFNGNIIAGVGIDPQGLQEPWIANLSSSATWTGGGTTDLWSDGNNWQGGVAPTAGFDLMFPSGALQETSVDDLGFTFSSITTADTYRFSGQPLTTTSLTVSQGSLELDSPTTVTENLSVEDKAILSIGNGASAANLTVAANATLSLIGILTVNTNATLQDNGTLTITGEGDLDDFGTANIGAGGTITVSQGLLLVGFNATLSDSGTLAVSEDASLADESTVSVINNGMLSNSGTISVGASASLNLGNGNLIENSGSVLDVQGQLTVGSSGTCSIGGTVALDGTDNVINNPGDSVLVSTPITASTPPSIQVEQAALQAAANDSDIFELIEALAKGEANHLPGDVVVVQGAQKLASWAKGASKFGLAATYSQDITALQLAYAQNQPEPFGRAYSKLTQDVNSDLNGLAWGELFGDLTVAASIADGGVSAPAIPLATFFGVLGGSAAYRTYYNQFLADDVTANGITLFFDLKNLKSTAVGGSGGTLSLQGSATVTATGNISDQDAVTVGSGAILDVFGNVTEGTDGVQEVFGTLVVEITGTLDIYGSVTIEPGSSYSPLGTVAVEPGGVLNQPSGISLGFSPAFVPAGTVGTAYTQTITAIGGDGGKLVAYEVTSDTTPAALGLTFTVSADGDSLIVSGTPTASGAISFEVTATDAADTSVSQSYTLTINPTNVTNQISVRRSGLIYNRATLLFGGTISITNSGTTTLIGTLQIELTGLPSTLTWANASGIAADGNPFIAVNLPNGILAQGQSITLSVYFKNPNFVSFAYGFLVLDEDASS